MQNRDRRFVRGRRRQCQPDGGRTCSAEWMRLVCWRRCKSKRSLAGGSRAMPAHRRDLPLGIILLNKTADKCCPRRRVNRQLWLVFALSTSSTIAWLICAQNGEASQTYTCRICIVFIFTSLAITAWSATCSLFANISRSHFTSWNVYSLQNIFSYSHMITKMYGMWHMACLHSVTGVIVQNWNSIRLTIMIIY